MFVLFSDQSNLLICKVEDSGSTRESLPSTPVCINTKNLQIFRGKFGVARYFNRVATSGGIVSVKRLLKCGNWLQRRHLAMLWYPQTLWKGSDLLQINSRFNFWLISLLIRYWLIVKISQYKDWTYLLFSHYR
jgi:hypothetical protein